MAMASQSDTSASRANIRIEIKNDFSEEMDVDESGESNPVSEEVEDGEISDGKDAEDAQTINKVTFNRKLATDRTENADGFAIDIDIFDKDEQIKRQTRAERFGLDAMDQEQGMTTITEQQLQNVHDSLGITSEDEVSTRFEAIHMYGTANMSTQEVFGYFGRFGPASIEWINDESCNVVWLDKISAARAFHGLSTAVAGMPVIGKCDPFRDDEKVDDADREKGRSILLMSKDKDRQVEVYNQPTMDMDMAVISHVSQINVPIPPGYWRLGSPHPKSKYLLLRYARRTDRKPFRAERFSEYYKKYGNPNFGGMVGLISESKKKRMKGLEGEPAVEVVKGNPWGNLAKNWHHSVSELVVGEAPIAAASAAAAAVATKPAKSILERLGIATQKRSQSVSDDDDTSIGKEELKAKKSKVPRMRMYADEEEARVLKVKQLKKLRALEEIEEIILKTTQPDLRNRISRPLLPMAKAAISESQAVEANVRLRPEQVRKKLVPVRRRVVSDQSDNDDDDLNVQQRSKVTLIVKKAVKPTVASTIWSRLDRENNALKAVEQPVEKDSDDSSSSANSSDDDSDSDEYDPAVRTKFSKAINHRPGFNRDLKSRLGLTSDHKSPLRIEINNDHYNNKS